MRRFAKEICVRTSGLEINVGIPILKAGSSLLEQQLQVLVDEIELGTIRCGAIGAWGLMYKNVKGMC